VLEILDFEILTYLTTLYQDFLTCLLEQEDPKELGAVRRKEVTAPEEKRKK
jgi:hypothetical protein